MTQRDTHRAAHGHGKPNGHANGHEAVLQAASMDQDSASLERGALPPTQARAASDDASGLSAAGTAPSAAACSTREAPVEAAPSEARAKGSRKSGTSPRPPKSPKSPKAETPEQPKIGPGAEPLPLDGPAFVEAVHEKVDLIELEVRLLRSEDEKIAQRELAYLRELIYGKNATPLDDEPPPIGFGAPLIRTE